NTVTSAAAAVPTSAHETQGGMVARWLAGALRGWGVGAATRTRVCVAPAAALACGDGVPAVVAGCAAGGGRGPIWGEAATAAAACAGARTKRSRALTSTAATSPDATKLRWTVS